jgi:hypothetical protein
VRKVVAQSLLLVENEISITSRFMIVVISVTESFVHSAITLYEPIQVGGHSLEQNKLLVSQFKPQPIFFFAHSHGLEPNPNDIRAATIAAKKKGLNQHGSSFSIASN